ncbi:unnamed protein product, partial [Rotaria sordida]
AGNFQTNNADENSDEANSQRDARPGACRVNGRGRRKRGGFQG